MLFTHCVSLLLVAIFNCVIAIQERNNRAFPGTINSRGRATYVDYKNRISTSSYEHGAADAIPTRGTTLRGNLRSSSDIAHNDIPKPYSFDYKTADEDGNMQYRKEEADTSGTVRGSYGYIDTEGLYRIVDYVADSTGFHINTKTNEPGVDGKEDPADVNLIVSEPPAGIQEKYNEFKGTGVGGTGPSTSRTRARRNVFNIRKNAKLRTAIFGINYPHDTHHLSGTIHGLFKSGINSAESKEDEYE
ncbi:uncharacterized protein LOC129967154 isoform X1 [Argiope bruennichi]|uniref:uncharacterized protein LOC129967154 isoform X1 n=1 Tax=Argiope bruennichi TaxID=94029 RepID=UPI0024957D9B|nr:uncharacterized protein LOC129967154 isoform X1 [Argiope bruennichi]